MRVIVIPATAVLIVVTGLVGLGLWPKSDTRLLADAYNKQRRTELRIPGAEPVTIASPVRGDTTMPIPSDLLKLKLRAQEHLEKDPNSSYWQQVLGRVALVEHDGEGARRKLEIADSLNNRDPEIKFDLAAAYFEIAESNEDPIQYARAADLYGRYIDQVDHAKQKNLLPEAYFNRALCWERQSVYFEALKDLKIALSLETNPRWRSDIQDRINKLSQKDTDNENKSEAQPMPYVNTFPNNSRQALQEIDDNYENYLDTAVREWIRRRGSSDDADRALRRLAVIGLQHNDSWVQRMLTSPKIKTADVALAEAVQANARGDADTGLAKSKTATDLYRKAGVRPGYLRAELETIFALQRLGRSSECLKRATPLRQDSELKNYSWLFGYLLLEISTCHGSQGDHLSSEVATMESLTVTEKARLPIERLRAQGFLAAELNSLGQVREAWAISNEGLLGSVRRPGTEARTYQFLSNIYFGARSARWFWAAEGLADAAAHTAQKLTNVQLQAYALEELGNSETGVHHHNAAEAAYRTASQKLRSMTAGDANALYNADWTSDRAQLLAIDGKIPLAIKTMTDVSRVVSSHDNFPLRQRYYGELARLLLDANRPDESIQQAYVAVSDAERALPTRKTVSQKIAWERDTNRSYRILVESLIAKGETEKALSKWEWFRTAPYRSVLLEKPSPSNISSWSTKPLLPVVPTNELVLVFARLERGFIAWSISGAKPAQIKMSPLPLELDKADSLTRILSVLSSDPDSSEADIRLIGAELYKDLLTPFADQIEHATLLRLEVDSSLSAIPFPVLVGPLRKYLGEDHAVLLLPAWWTLQSFGNTPLHTVQNALIVTGTPAATPTQVIPIEYEESMEVAKHFKKPNLMTHPGLSVHSVLASLPSSEIFHFTGHAVSSLNGTGLVLGVKNEVLTANDLEGVPLRRCQLAVLAACATSGKSQDESEDSQSLVHAFLLAGTQNVVATGWEVDSKTSRELMLHFYDSLDSNIPPAEALQAAQKTIRLHPLTQHPYYWAAFKDYSQ